MRMHLVIVSWVLIPLVSCDVKKVKKVDLGEFEQISISVDYEGVKLLKAYNVGTCDGKSETRANVYLIKMLSNKEELFLIEPCREFSQLAERDLHEIEKHDFVVIKAIPLADRYVYIPEDADIPEGSKVIWGSLKMLGY